MARVNRAIELLEQGQPVYYSSPRELSYEGGVEASQTWSDYLVVEMEHGTFNLAGLDAFMKGIAASGPTKSGHHTPTVITTLPTDGTDEHVMRANAWMVKQVLARGVHGILLCHAETPGAVKVFVESARYPIHTIGVGAGLDVGRRGAGGQGNAAAIWGISVEEYMRRADVWPLNPDGEIFLGLKIENKRALSNAEATARVPGIAFAEWGPGDMALSHGHFDRDESSYAEVSENARMRVKAACDAENIAFLDGATQDNIAERIDSGVRIPSCGEEVANIGRKHTNRTMPW